MTDEVAAATSGWTCMAASMTGVVTIPPPIPNIPAMTPADPKINA
eukprot:CAMPEP_0195245778 /NCGR_PEP_ID=MMETSP0706-20130129/38_1 /TAXON_ID=33640 /ORGANISM="Asterionellopsis glacialis, Strain CCMP134" /LENGTH=44 /DNA_ID= /DNA_START= /DNA_END= /DNA_ORIENTATION=